MNKNLRLVINNSNKLIEDKHFFEKDELKIILDLYAKMVSEGSWKDYGLSISSKQVGFSVFKFPIGLCEGVFRLVKLDCVGLSGVELCKLVLRGVELSILEFY